MTKGIPKKRAKAEQFARSARKPRPRWCAKKSPKAIPVPTRPRRPSSAARGG